MGPDVRSWRMCEEDRKLTGAVAWTDLTVENAGEVRDFYTEVVGWTVQPFDMGGYEDYGLASPDNGMAMAGICHARGVNEDLPAQWLIYITVKDLDNSIAQVARLGGTLIRPPTDMGQTGRFAVIKDPAGAVCALMQWAEVALDHHHHHDHDHDHDSDHEHKH
jgi:uncharacterized protein